jgi:hypothetical protein
MDVTDRHSDEPETSGCKTTEMAGGKAQTEEQDASAAQKK